MSHADTGFRRDSTEPEHPVPADGRLIAVDNLKALLVAWIIGAVAVTLVVSGGLVRSTK